MSKAFRRFLAAGAAALALTTASMPAHAAAERFTDVKPGAWYYTAVDYAVSEKLFSGTAANTFSPNTPMTRAMFVRVLGNKAGIDPNRVSVRHFQRCAGRHMVRAPCGMGGGKQNC